MNTPKEQAADPATGSAPDVALDPSAATELPEDIAALSYEDARDQLVDIVRRLEAGTTGLEESITLWERGEALATRCRQWLDGAQERLDRAAAVQKPRSPQNTPSGDE